MTDSRDPFVELSAEEALQKLQADPAQGLDSGEAAQRLRRHGPNALPEAHTPLWRRLLTYFWGPIPWMIEIAALLSALVRHWEDFAIIVVMLLINAGIGFWEEYKADNALAALKKNLALRAQVLRDGRWQTLPARELVPGDIIRLTLGAIVPADVKLLAGDFVSIDQAALTGESLPVDKQAGDVAWSGSTVRAGEMTAVVTATGGNTYFGRTAQLVSEAGAVSHFQRAVLHIGNFLILGTLGLVLLIVVVALFRQDPLVETLLFALILTVAAIPVALPAVLSVTMAVGAVRLARMKAIVSRLVAIEEMAGMDVLCTDKTGTLTRNALEVGDPVTAPGVAGEVLLQTAFLASRADHPDDPIDAAVVAALPGEKRPQGYRVVTFKPFDPVAKRAEAVVHLADGRQARVAKGAPQVIIELAGLRGEALQAAQADVEELAGRGFRTLGVARDDGDGWRYLGLLPLFDPPREDAVATIDSTRELGLEIRMVTGDHIAIARETARQLHLSDRLLDARQLDGDTDDEAIEKAGGFAQVFPEHKYRIVRALQERGHIVGMTGDGVNDAPALKQADIGIAVSGATDAARAAADLVLTAPGLAVIVHAITEARRIFERMTGYAIFRIAETIRVLLFMTLSILVFNFYPVTAAMIVLLAILNDLPIMMIAYDNVPVAQQPVRWDMPRVLTLASVLGVTGVLSSFLLFWVAEHYLAMPRETIRTLIFLKLLVAGHLTIYLTRNTGTIWQRPWPAWRLFVTTEATQVIGTLAAVYGWLVTPIGWGLALAVWGYALVWFFINSGVKLAVLRMIELRGRRQASHLERVTGSLQHPR